MRHGLKCQGGTIRYDFSGSDMAVFVGVKEGIAVLEFMSEEQDLIVQVSTEDLPGIIRKLNNRGLRLQILEAL